MMPSLPPSNFSRLYEEAQASRSGDVRDPAEDLSPLYHALSQSEVRYGTEEPIGVGGMKEVVRVYDERTERHVALARPKQGVPPEQYDAFLREAHITARLEHPNIINLFDMGIDDRQRPFFTMEFKRGLSLRKILSTLKEGNEEVEYPYERRLSVFLRVCEAMAYAHSRHVLHLDLKPENIQIGTFGEVQVCDWGMGEIEQGESEAHLSETLLDPDLYGGQTDPPVKGTPGYMAPEQGDPKAPKAVQNDIFSLGCLLYELSTLNSSAQRDAKPPTSPAVAAIVSKACAADPAERYASVETIREDVNRHLMGFSSGAEQAGFYREVGLFYRRNKLPCVISLCSALLVVATAVWFNQKLRGSHQLTTEALARTETALDETDQARRRAEEALVRHRQERDFAVALVESRGERSIENVLFLIDSLMMKEGISLPVVENAILEIDKALADNPPPKDQLWPMKAYVLFMTQRFEQAERFYAVREGDQGPLRALIPEFAPLIGENDLLSPGDFIRLMERLSTMSKSRHPLMEKMVIYDTLKRNSPADTAVIVEALLKLSNPDWTASLMEYQPETARLRISGPGLHSLYRGGARRRGQADPPRSLLRLLKLNSLDLSGSEISDLWNLDGLHLHRLDIRQTPVTDLEPIAGMTSLRELIITPGQFSPEQLELLPGAAVVREIEPPQE